MFTLELSSIVMKIANYAYRTPSRNLIGCQESRVLQADWLILENNEKATLSVNTPYRNLESFCTPFEYTNNHSTDDHCQVLRT
mgnify:CR=1 FL=1